MAWLAQDHVAPVPAEGYKRYYMRAGICRYDYDSGDVEKVGELYIEGDALDEERAKLSMLTTLDTIAEKEFGNEVWTECIRIGTDESEVVTRNPLAEAASEAVDDMLSEDEEEVLVVESTPMGEADVVVEEEEEVTPHEFVEAISFTGTPKFPERRQEDDTYGYGRRGF
jgi:hypothetical protein